MELQCEIECTVVSGFEAVARDEVQKRLHLEVFESVRGRVNFKVPFSRIREVSSLRSVDNFHCILKRFPSLPFSADETESLKLFRPMVEGIDWQFGLEVWKEYFGESITSLGENTSSDTGDQASETKAAAAASSTEAFLPRYRVTCKRTGTHSFQSPQAAHHFGGAINDLRGWVVDLSNFQVEVMLLVVEREVRVGVALSQESLHRRNITHFGPTTLKPTIVYGMLWHAGIQPGDIVCDPMCGTSSITIECLDSQQPACFNLSADISKKLVKKSLLNWQDAKAKKPAMAGKGCLDFLKWDVTRLPLKPECVDVIVTDLPFGKRMGSKVSNWGLYKGLLFECARVLRKQTGRVCLLTHDHKCIIRTMELASRYFRRGSTVGINIGGLAAGVYVLYRNANAFVPGGGEGADDDSGRMRGGGGGGRDDGGGGYDDGRRNGGDYGGRRGGGGGYGRKGGGGWRRGVGGNGGRRGDRRENEGAVKDSLVDG